MTKNQKLQKRENRQNKRRLKHALVMQSKEYPANIPCWEYGKLNTSFSNFALNETIAEISNNEVQSERIDVLSRAVDLGRKISSYNKLQYSVGRTAIMYNAFESTK